MILLLAVLTVLQAEDPFQAVRQARRALYSQPLAQRLNLVLSSNKTHYSVREPIRLKMTLSNPGKESVTGYFMAAPLSPKSEIRYRRRDSAFANFPYPGRKGIYGDGRYTLGPGERMTDEDIIAFDPARQSFVFDEPGDYEFQVIYRDAREEPNAVLESNTLQVVVEPPSSSEVQEFQAFTQDLALLTQFDPSWSLVTLATLKEAIAFIERFPASVYRQEVEKGLLRALYSRIVMGRATQEERELFDRLKPESP